MENAGGRLIYVEDAKGMMRGWGILAGVHRVCHNNTSLHPHSQLTQQRISRQRTHQKTLLNICARWWYFVVRYDQGVGGLAAAGVTVHSAGGGSEIWMMGLAQDGAKVGGCTSTKTE